MIFPERKVDLYKEGFDQEGLIDRKPLGDKLSDLVERVDAPLVIALDGAWGTGKSLFLKLWAGEHSLDSRRQSGVVYFDAFESDFLDDPLIAITSTINERFGEEPDKKSALSKVKVAASKLWRPAARIGLAAATAGVSEGANVAVDAALDASSDELSEAVNKFWKMEDGKRTAMKQFRSALVELTETDDHGNPTKKLVVIVDELDRCRPDYALALLETIKHFFTVPGVHFVLGVNIPELENTVRARYGLGVNASKYLQKFVNVRMPFGMDVNGDGYTSDVLDFWGKIGSGLPEVAWSTIWLYLKEMQFHQNITFRDMERIATLARLVPRFSSRSEILVDLISGLIILQVMSPSLLDEARHGSLTLDSVEAFFGIKKNTDQYDISGLWGEWRLALDAQYEPTSDEDRIISRIRWPRHRVIPNLVKKYVDVFEPYLGS